MQEMVPQTGVMGSRELSTTACAAMGLPEELQGIDLLRIPARLDDQMLEKLEAIANCPMPEYLPTDREHFDKCMRSLAILPRKADDDLKARLKLALYWRKLENYPAPALAWLVEEGIERFDWFPTIKQCLELLRKWPDRERAAQWRRIARQKIEREHEARYGDARRGIRFGQLTEDDIPALPAAIKRRLAGEEMLELVDDLADEPTYRIRPGACWAKEEEAAAGDSA